MNFQSTAKAKERKSSDWWKNGIPDKITYFLIATTVECARENGEY